MIERASTAVAVILHIVIVMLLGKFTFALQPAQLRKNGMEIEIIDLEHAMPDARPVIAGTSKSEPLHPRSRDVEATASENAAAASDFASREPEVAETAGASNLKLESSESVPQPAPVPESARVVEEPAQVAGAASAPRSTLGEVRAPRLDTTTLAAVREIASTDNRPTRLNSATLGSAAGKAAPRGLQGLTLRQKIDLAEKVRAQVMPCWNPPTADGPVSISVRLSFRLDRNGRVVGQPVRSAVIGQSEDNAAYINLLTNSGRRAVLMCSPLQLPPELYEAWANVEVEFDPRDLR